MSAKRWDGAAQIDLTTFKRWDGSAFQDIATGQRWDGGAWVNLGIGGSSLSATASSGSVSGHTNGDADDPIAVTVVSSAVTVTAAGGAGAGPTYAWTRLSGDSGITANSPTSATTTFQGTVFNNAERNAVFRCTVTRGVDSVTVDVSVSLTYVKGEPA